MRTPMTHHMRLRPSPFKKIKTGSKTIEVRLNDEKRQQLKAGDLLVFSLQTDPAQTVETKIVALYRYPSFSALFAAHLPTDFGGESETDMANIRKFYSETDEQRYGVLGIRIECKDAEANVPQIINDVGFDFNWSEEKVWALTEPVEAMPITDLTWHFTIPFLWENGGVYNLTPQDVLNQPELHKAEYERTMRADLAYPIDIMQNKGRWLILDGLHRLMKAASLGHTIVQVRKIPRERISEIQK